MTKLPKINAICLNNFKNTPDCYLIIMKEEVYDISSILKTHVGGIELFNKCKNETEKHFYFHSSRAKKKWKSLKVGQIQREKVCQGCFICQKINNK